MLIRGRFLFMRPFPALQIPNLKTPAAADEGNFLFQSDSFAKLFGQNQTALSICGTVLRARVQLPQKNAPIVRGNGFVRFYGRAHRSKFLR
jgi:hypothetical protein